MKKNILIALAAGVALAACTKNEVRPVSTDQEITFEAAVYKASSKALIATNKYPESATFGTVAYLELANNSGSVYIDTAEVKFNSTHSYWSPDTEYYWPVKGSLSFMSYSPYRYQESNGTKINVTHVYNKLTIADYDVAAHQKTDLMVAEIKKGQKKENTTQQGGTWQKGVPTIFHHKLSQIVAINFQTVNTQDPSAKKDYANGNDGTELKRYMAGDQQYFLNEVALCETCFTGSYEYTYDDAFSAVTKDEWTKESTIVDKTLWFTEPSAYPNVVGKFIGGEIVPDRTDDAGNPVTNDYILILPQTFESYTLGNESTVPHIYIKYTVRTYYADNKLNTDNDGFSDETIEAVVPLYDIHSTNHTWAMNKKITYTFNLTKQRIYWDPKVENWTPESPSVTI